MTNTNNNVLLDLQIQIPIDIPLDIKNILIKNIGSVQKKFLDILYDKIYDDNTGFIYGFSNNSDNNNDNQFWIKIGRTKREDPHCRVDEWKGNIEFCQKTKHNKKLERLVHLLFNYANQVRVFNDCNQVEWFYFQEYTNIVNIISILNRYLEIFMNNNKNKIDDENDKFCENNKIDDNDNGKIYNNKINNNKCKICSKQFEHILQL